MWTIVSTLPGQFRVSGVRIDSGERFRPEDASNCPTACGTNAQTAARYVLNPIGLPENIGESFGKS